MSSWPSRCHGASSPFITARKSHTRQMHLPETMRLYMDGGVSMRRVREQVSILHEHLSTLLQCHNIQ